MKYIAHRIEDTGKEQALKEHLTNVAELCRKNSVPELKEVAYLCGLLHDIGKYTKQFQERIRGANIRVEHAMYGAKQIRNDKRIDYAMSSLLEYCIAGHHTGLPDGGTAADVDEMSTLNGVLKRETADFSGFKDEIDYNVPKDDVIKKYSAGLKSNEDIIELYSFLTRYIYSCLTDADFLDTESFFSPDIERGLDGDFEEAYVRVCEELKSFNAVTELQKTRGYLQEQVYENIKQDAEVYTLDMPTGSGKTLCSIKAALELLLRKNKKRIIYVIPYTSVIEQTAKICEDIFGEVLPVVQHHSNFDVDGKENEDETTKKKLLRTCENWDAPFIITTNVQFFESLYHFKSSKLRKMHNLADSIIVFDEIHMLPIECIQPCMRAIGYISKYLNSISIMMSATMPNYKEFISRYVSDCRIVDLVNDKSRYSVFQKCRIKYIGECGVEKLALESEKYKSVLIIVNNRKKVRMVYDACIGKKYHLSTYMTPENRSEMISRIRDDLAHEKNITVVSTSLIEAGVDVDFECVFRENAGIDNILQSAGRCNREGFSEYGDVYVFELGNSNKDTQVKANITRSLFEEYDDISDSSCVAEYYKRLFKLNDDVIEKNRITELMGTLRFDAIPFRKYSESFEIIKNTMISVIIPNKENETLIEELKYGKISNKRKLQKYCASIYPWEFEDLYEQGVLEIIFDVCVLTNPDYYSDAYGIYFEGQDYLVDCV